LTVLALDRAVPVRRVRAVRACSARGRSSRGSVDFGALEETTGRASKFCSRAQIVQFWRRRLCRQKVGIAAFQSWHVEPLRLDVHTKGVLGGPDPSGPPS
jgi:hypothetical protein